MKILKHTVIAVVLATPLVAFAQGASTPGFDQRQVNQERRIEQGVESGSLTQREAARLERGQDRLQNMENKAKADGVVSRQERVRLQRAENKQSQRIYREKHDRQHDYNRDGRIDRPAKRNR